MRGKIPKNAVEVGETYPFGTSDFCGYTLLYIVFMGVWGGFGGGFGGKRGEGHPPRGVFGVFGGCGRGVRGVLEGRSDGDGMLFEAYGAPDEGYSMEAVAREGEGRVGFGVVGDDEEMVVVMAGTDALEDGSLVGV